MRRRACDRTSMMSVRAAKTLASASVRRAVGCTRPLCARTRLLSAFATEDVLFEGALGEVELDVLIVLRQRALLAGAEARQRLAQEVGERREGLVLLGRTQIQQARHALATFPSRLGRIRGLGVRG